MGEFVHPQHYRGALKLPFAFLMASSDTLMNMDALSHMELLVPDREGNDELFWSIQGDVFSVIMLRSTINSLLINSYFTQVKTRKNTSTKNPCQI